MVGSRRIAFLTLGLVTATLGMLVHLRGSALGPATRDVLGDALWAAMIAWLVGAAAPSARLMMRCTVAYVICVAVELSQLLHTPALDALRATTIGHLVLGSDFVPRDLAAYAGGVGGAAMIEAAASAWRRRTRSS